MTGRDFLRAYPDATLVPDVDADGLSSAALVLHALARAGGKPRIVLPGRGEHAHSPSLRERLAGSSAVIALDQGSRAGDILPGVPTLVVDHHVAHGFPPNAVVVSQPAPSTSLLAFELIDEPELAWLAALGIFADLGEHPLLDAQVAQYGRRAFSEAAALVNAPRRTPAHRADAALLSLLEARSVREVPHTSTAPILADARAQVAAEVARCSRVAPRFAGRVALVEFSSTCKVHPLIAQRWVGRLKGKIVLAANSSWLPGRVNFALRSGGGEDLLAFLRAHGLVANGHARATGGSLLPHEFASLLATLGFEPRHAAASEGALLQ